MRITQRETNSSNQCILTLSVAYGTKGCTNQSFLYCTTDQMTTRNEQGEIYHPTPVCLSLTAFLKSFFSLFFWLINLSFINLDPTAPTKQIKWAISWRTQWHIYLQRVRYVPQELVETKPELKITLLSDLLFSACSAAPWWQTNATLNRIF